MVRQEGERQVSRQIGHYTLAAVLFESYAMQRRATVDADGKAYAARMQQAPSGDEQGVTVLGQVAKKLAKKKGRSDAT
ncbi:hypothetical protein ABIC99_003616 [Sphaerotilus sulfidivorans]|uniref:Uncharacterized protein n=1 Tax=Sphaerotilus sulfidivorans TaxID=639200 RepID=A0ABV2IUE7_9BURK|nr:hypothetical protein [Sphaerotilus sulfidivorans]